MLAAFPGAVILRPSIIFGTEDGFFNRFAAMSRMGPILPVVGADTRFQPVYVDDVAQAAVKGVLGQAAARRVYELGGPEVDSFRGLMQRDAGRDPAPPGGGEHSVLRAARSWRFAFDALQAVTLGLIENKMITRDQVRNLARDNVVAPDARGLADLGIAPTAMDAVLPDYLWRYRPSGQYAAIKDSAKNAQT